MMFLLWKNRGTVQVMRMLCVGVLLLTCIGAGSVGPFALDLPEYAVSERAFSSAGVRAHSKRVAAEFDGPGCINHIWVVTEKGRLTHPRFGVVPGRHKTEVPNRKLIMRIYFDGSQTPNVESPIGDFFGLMHGVDYYPINTEFLSVLPWDGYNSYFQMPFATSARIEMEAGDEEIGFSMQVDWHRYPDQEMKEKRRFCGAWRRENPCQSYGEDYFMLDVDGPGQLIGFVYGVRLSDNEDRWSHGGAENLYIDGLGRDPTYIRGLGGEDTFGTTYGGAVYDPTTHLYTSMPYYVHEDTGEARPAQRLVGYRFFVKDSIRWHQSLHMRFGSMQNDICSMVYWYQEGPVRSGIKFPKVSQCLPGMQLPREETIAELPYSGSWKVGGPFENKDNSGIAKALDGTLLTKIPEQVEWVMNRRAYHGFVDFNHLWRPHRRGVAVHYSDKVSVAQAILTVAQAMTASIRVAWDDHLVMQVNQDKPINMGEQSLFRKKTIQVRLEKGDNLVTLVLSNERRGLNFGGWAFAFRATDPSDNIIVPRSPQ